MDLTCPSHMREEAVIIGGKMHDEWVYGDFQAEMDMINMAFAEVMLEGDAIGQILSFPIPTYNITKDFDWSNPAYEGIWKMAGKYGIPYFTNYINSDLDPEDARSMCPLPLDTKIIVKPISRDEVYTMTLEDIIHHQAKIGDTQKLSDCLMVRYKGEWSLITALTQHKMSVVVFGVDGKDEVKMGRRHLQTIVRDGVWMDVPAESVWCGDMFPYENFETGEITLHKVLVAHHHPHDEVEYLWCLEVNNEDHRFTLASGLITHNCRLRLDLTELRRRGGGLFGSGGLTGSIGVVTINMPRIGYLADSSEDYFFEMLNEMMDLARDSLVIKRQKMVEPYTEQGLYPYCKFYLRDIKARLGSYWANHFSTIGLLGMHEACLNMGLGGIQTEEGKAFAKRVLNHMRERLMHYQAETGDMFNLEATPAEGVSYRMFRADQERYNMELVGTHYTNSTHLPVSHTADLFEALEHQSDLQELYTGGTVLHGFIGAEITNTEVAKELIRSAFTQFKLPYLSLTPTFSICQSHGYLTGEQSVCPHCGDDTLVYSRVVGFLRPVSAWNDGKKAEFKDRKVYDVNASLMHGHEAAE